ncbi:uncharacterized protein LOC124289080 [Haliotis rubra]|uniref:uncharacterized protein LOC124289080 n=1 Tax=Haliotis rubra TaxID=36100 RepID=UPI001EE566B4|nr:uncharacterized protein LOC124289080 [Haliotis rubra]
MPTFGDGIVVMSSLKGVVVLVVAVTFLLSALLWSLPGDNEHAQWRVSSQQASSAANPVKERVKKSAQIKETCKVMTPSKDDMRLLKLLSRDSNKDSDQGKHNSGINEQVDVTRLATCSVLVGCDGRESVTCKTNVCSHFTVKMGSPSHIIHDVSPDALGEIVRLRGSNITGIDVMCDQGNTKTVSDNHWQSVIIRRRRKCQREENITKYPQNIHIINVRFLSRWELFARMKRLSELVASEPQHELKVLDFSKYQSLVWEDNDNLRALLQGQVAQNDSKPTLIDIAKQQGFNVRVFDLSEEDYHRSLDLKHILENSSTECLFVGDRVKPFADIPSCECSIYQGAEYTPEQKLEELQKCLSSINGIPTTNKVLTMTFLENTHWEFSIEKAVDDAITDIINSVIRDDIDSIVLLMSDVGNPSFSRLDQSLFMQTQASNPFLAIFYPSSSENESKLAVLAQNRDKLISVEDIHLTILDFISSVPTVDNGNKLEGSPSRYRGLSLLRSIIPSRSTKQLGVRPPSFPICESRQLRYPNDTIQAAFAETVVGFMNNYIQDRMKTDKRIRNSCRPVIGVRFLNVRKSHQHGRSVTLMDLEIRAVSTKNVIPLKDVTVTLKQESHSNHSLEVNTKDGGLKTLLEGHILPSVCSGDMDVNFSLIAKSKIPLFLRSAVSFGAKPRMISVHGECLFLLVRGFADSAGYYVMNVCDDRQYDFVFSGRLINVFSFVTLPVKLTVKPGQVHFVTAFVKASYFVHELFFHYETHHHMTLL